MKAWLIAQLPDAHRTPLRYWYRTLAGRLDPEIAVLRRLIRPGSRVVDIGANVGFVSYGMSLDATVEAFEPMPLSLHHLRALARRRTRIHVHGVALSDVPGLATLYIPTTDGHPDLEMARLDPPTPSAVGFESMTVEVRTLDTYAFADVSLIKIDVEGHERAVLAGAAQTIARERPALMIEIEQRHQSAPLDQVFDDVRRLGYDGYWFTAAGDARPLADFRYARDQAPYADTVSDPRYINNFFFLPAGDPRVAQLGAVGVV
jgi:FkbM family methyltransferase